MSPPKNPQRHPPDAGPTLRGHAGIYWVLPASHSAPESLPIIWTPWKPKYLFFLHSHRPPEVYLFLNAAVRCPAWAEVLILREKVSS